MNIPMVTKYGKYWSCQCNRILHTEEEAKAHQYKHTLQILEIRNQPIVEDEKKYGN